MDWTGAGQGSEQLIVLMSYAECFEVAIVFGNSGDDSFHLGHQDFDVQHRGSHYGQVVSQRDGGFDLSETALIGSLAGGMMRAEEVVEGRRPGSLQSCQLGPALEEVTDQAGAHNLEPRQQLPEKSL